MGKPCEYESCDRDPVARGLCSAHYSQWHSGRELTPIRAKRPNHATATCSFPGCEHPSNSRGLCGGHYQQSCKGQELRPLRKPYESDTCSFPGCDNTRRSFGLCDGHYYQQSRGLELRPIKSLGQPLAWLREALAIRERGDDCWLDWPFALSRSGMRKSDAEGDFLRPHLAFEGKNVKAARLVVFLETGAWPENALHTCDQPMCLNPKHIYDGTQADNIRDMFERGRDRHSVARQ